MLSGTQPEDLPHEGLGVDVRASLPRGTPHALVKTLEAMLEPDPDHRAASIDEALGLLEESAPKGRKQAPKAKKQKTKTRKARRAARRRIDARSDFPLAQWVFFQVALFAGAGAVWLATGVFVPFVVVLAVLLYGERVRRRMKAEALRARVTGPSAEQAEQDARVRIATDDAAAELAAEAEEEEQEEPRDKLRR
jgi:hypothetical protein